MSSTYSDRSSIIPRDSRNLSEDQKSAKLKKFIRWRKDGHSFAIIKKHAGISLPVAKRLARDLNLKWEELF